MFQSRWLVAGLTVALAGMVAPLSAQSSLTPDVVGGVLLKVLSYDRALARNGAGDVVVGVVFDPSEPKSARAREAVGGAMRNVSTIAGRGVRILDVEVSKLQEALKAQRVMALYVTPGLDRELSDIVTAADRGGITTLGETRSYARRGVAVAVDNYGGRPALFINLPAARREGADLPSSVLALATVIQ